MVTQYIRSVRISYSATYSCAERIQLIYQVTVAICTVSFFHFFHIIFIYPTVYFLVAIACYHQQMSLCATAESLLRSETEDGLLDKVIIER